MIERRRVGIRRRPAPGGGIWDDPGNASGADLATVSHGPYAERLPVVNMSVAGVRDRFQDRFDIDPASQAYVGGVPVSDDTIIRAGQLLVFMRPAGEKGPA